MTKGKENRRRVAILAFIGISLLTLLLVSTWSTAWATPSQQDGSTLVTPAAGQIGVTVDPASKVQVTTPKKEIVVDIPAGASKFEAQVFIEVKTPAVAPEPPANTKIGSQVVEIDIWQSGVKQPNFRFQRPITLTFQYTDDDLKAAGGDHSKLRISFYDTATKSWIKLITTWNIFNKTISAQVGHVTLFGILVEEPAPPTPVPTATPAPTATLAPGVTPTPPKVGDVAPSSGMLLGAVILGLGLVVMGGLYLRRRTL